MREKLVILGAGESGVGAAILGKKKDFSVFVSDFGVIKEKYKKVLEAHDIAYEEKQHTQEKILDADMVVKSPGISDKAPIVQQLVDKKIPVISEIEFAGKYIDATKVCITGSNGKTTTTLMIYELLKGAGLNVGLAGNVGKSLAWQVAENEYDYYVIELSSFQLDGMHDFKADVAILLNITPDHMDRYDNKMERYIDSKFRIIRNQTAGDSFIYCADDPVIAKALKDRTVDAQMLPFSLSQETGKGAFVEEEELVLRHESKEMRMSIYDLALKGKHNTYNSMAAGIAGMVLQIRNEHIRECLTSFKGVEHRLEPFIKVHGIRFINDSKATNVNSTWYALESMDKPVVWIAGGIDKGNDYSVLEELVQEKVKALICLGVDNTPLHKAFDGKVNDIIDVQSMDEAVKAAYYLAQKDDVVLLSPACASFDLFENYEDRGQQFKKAVRKL